MAKILRLSPQISNLIAAGEVVERPGAVAKELIENAIDAGATRICVEMKNGGVSYLRITDNGSGIERDDVRTAFLRHATSKIRTASDLDSIYTLGFRGEALAAISAVSRIDLFTRTKYEAEGTQITLDGGKEIDFTETGCPVGTTIIVRDLFYNVPARMKFLKKDATEGAYVEAAVVHAALSRPDLSFQLIKDGRETINTPGKGTLTAAIYAVYGRELAEGMISTVGSFHDIIVEGCVSSPMVTRATRSLQCFFVNNRVVRSKILTAALDEAYGNRLMHGRNAVCFLNIRVSPEMVDVNVHPAKMEIKFTREKDVFRALHNTIKSALEADDQISRHPPAQRPEPEPAPEQMRISAPAPKGEFMSEASSFAQTPPLPRKEYVFPETDAQNYVQVANTQRPQYVNAAGDMAILSDMLKNLGCMEEDRIPEPPARSEAATMTALPVEAAAPSAAPPVQRNGIRVVGELFSTYIIAQEKDGFWLIDKHAAHERMIYTDLVAAQEDQMSQMLLQPVTVVLSQPEKAACLAGLEQLEKMGFVAEDIGAQALLVRQAPLYLDEKDIPSVLSEIAEKLTLPGKAKVEIYDSLLKSVACKAAIKAGQFSDMVEMQRLAEKVLSLPDVRNCPHGRPVAVYTTQKELEKKFKRIV